MDNKENADVHAEIDELDELSAHSFEERHTPQSVKSGSAASLEKPTPYSNVSLHQNDVVERIELKLARNSSDSWLV